MLEQVAIPNRPRQLVRRVVHRSFVLDSILHVVDGAMHEYAYAQPLRQNARSLGLDDAKAN
ncbi:hypothetical protein D3C72_2553930 [compost metagenome]